MSAEWVVAFAGVASAAVTFAALVVAYGQAIGWKPLLVVKRWGLLELRDGIGSTTAFEVWNRRRYPIVVRRMKVDYNRVKMSELRDVTKGEKDPNWTVMSGELHHWDEYVIDPGAHRAFTVDALCIQEGPFPDEEARRLTVKVLLFDPVWSKRFVLKETGKVWGDGHPEFD